MSREAAETIPTGLEEMDPGPILGVILSSLDVGELSGHDRIVVLGAHQRMASHYQAQIYEDMAAVRDSMTEFEDDSRWAAESAAAEIRAALRLTRRSADAELGLALELKERLGAVWDALDAGTIDARRARVIAHGTTHLPDDTARRVADRVIERAPMMTSGQLAALIRKLCVEIDPDNADRRFKEAISERRVVTEATEAGTANLMGMDLPPHRVLAVTRRITELAQSLKSPDEPRTMDQLRADVLLDLLESGGSASTGKTGVVDIRVDLDTLAHLAETPGDLAGYGPVVADIAREVAQRQIDGPWRYTIVDPATGRPIHGGTTRRRPTTGQRRHVEALAPSCIFPGCRMPATACDLDHEIPWSEGGPTAARYLAPLCRHDHRIRHTAGWKRRSLPNGDHVWTSRLGHTYTTSGRPP